MTSNSIRIASHNVNGLSSTQKQLALIQALEYKSLDIVGIIDTKLKRNQFEFAFPQTSDYKVYWSPLSEESQAGGVGLLIHSSYDQYVQKVTKWKGRLIIADLFMKGRQRLRIINAYLHPLSSANNVVRAEIVTEIIARIKEASSYQCIIMGDFNTNLDDFHDYIEQGRKPPTRYNLYKFLDGRGYVDSHPTFEDLTIPTFIRKDANTHTPLHSTRIDTIWISPTLLPDLLFTETWDTTSFYNSDHYMVISYVSTSFIAGAPLEARLKQKKEKRGVFSYDKMNDDKWKAFSLDTDCMIDQQITKFPGSSKSSINNDLNRRWEIFQTAVIKAAKNKIPRSWKSPATRQRISDDLLKVYKHLSTINRILQRFSN